MLFYIIALIVVVLDQVTKVLVRINMDMHEKFTSFGIEFTYIENSGMAGGLFLGYARLFGIVAALFILFGFFSERTRSRVDRLLIAA